VPVPVESLKTRFFDFSQRTVLGEERLAAGSGEFVAVYAARGAISIDGVAHAEGDSVLLPPDSSCAMVADGARVFVTRFGR